VNAHLWRKGDVAYFVMPGATEEDAFVRGVVLDPAVEVKGKLETCVKLELEGYSDGLTVRPYLLFTTERKARMQLAMSAFKLREREETVAHQVANEASRQARASWTRLQALARRAHEPDPPGEEARLWAPEDKAFMVPDVEGDNRVMPIHCQRGEKRGYVLFAYEDGFAFSLPKEEIARRVRRTEEEALVLRRRLDVERARKKRTLLLHELTKLDTLLREADELEATHREQERRATK